MHHYGRVEARKGSNSTLVALVESDAEESESESSDSNSDEESGKDTQAQGTTAYDLSESMKLLVKRLGSCPYDGDPIRVQRLIHDWMGTKEGTELATLVTGDGKHRDEDIGNTNAWSSPGSSASSVNSKWKETTKVSEVLGPKAVDPQAIPHRVYTAVCCEILDRVTRSLGQCVESVNYKSLKKENRGFVQFTLTPMY